MAFRFIKLGSNPSHKEFLASDDRECLAEIAWQLDRIATCLEKKK